MEKNGWNTVMIRPFLVLGCLGLSVGIHFNSSYQRQEEVPQDGRYVKSQVVEDLFEWVPEELRGGVYRPAKPVDKIEGYFYAENVRLKHALSDWTQLDVNESETKVTRVRMFGFAQVNGGKRLDVAIEDELVTAEFKNAVDYSNVFRPCVTDLGEGWNQAYGAFILGVIQISFEDDRRPIIIGVSQANFNLGACYGPSSQWFYSPRFAEVLDKALKHYTDGKSGLPEKAIHNLQGRKYFD